MSLATSTSAGAGPGSGEIRNPLSWSQMAIITLAAAAIYAGLRMLPTGTSLSHMDFRATGENVIEFCDPLNPQFISVVAARSPVTMAVAPDPAAVGMVEAGREVQAVVTLKTGSGKAIAPEDLLITHTRALHLLLIDPSLTDYQHVHPVPGARTGEWQFSFTPRRAGMYRVFADFTPVATARGLYASADLIVAGADAAPPTTGGAEALVTEREGFRFTLATSPARLRAGEPFDLAFAITRPDGEPVRMQPVMGAYAHLVAFDGARNGFAHLHPMETSLEPAPDAYHPRLSFKLTIPEPGRYVIWAQVNLADGEVFAPFWIEVSASGENL